MLINPIATSAPLRNRRRQPWWMMTLMMLAFIAYLSRPTHAAEQIPGAIANVPVAISSGSFHTCVLKSDGSIACWGNNENGETAAPSGIYQQVDAGADHTCALNQDNAVICWGSNDSQQATPPAGAFTQVSAGFDHTCALATNGAVLCWGNNDSNQASPPADLFTQISAGNAFTCGVKQNGALACWGNDDDGEASPPAGVFKQVSVGDFHACAIRNDNRVVCWGDNSAGQVSAPDGAFQWVSAGSEHSCGLLSEGVLRCWGENLDQQATPPTERFIAVDAGDYHNCALSSDSRVVCWGDNTDGQAPTLELSPASLSIGTVGVAYSQTIDISAAGYTVVAPRFSLAAGALPTGITFDVTSGVLTGVPTIWGENTFILRVVDANGFSGQQAYTLHINTPPVANHLTLRVGQNTPKAITLSASDSDQDALSYMIVDRPQHGVLSNSAPNVAYTPQTGYSGPDSFTFKVSDGQAESNVGIVQITVLPTQLPNTPPIAQNKNLFTPRNTPKPITLGATDADDNPLAFTLLRLPTHGALSGTPPTLTYIPGATFVGVDDFTFKVNDGQVDSNIATIALVVIPINTPPTANSQNVVTERNLSKVIRLTAADTDGDMLDYTLLSNPVNGVLNGTAPNLTYIPQTNFVGVDSFTFMVNDGQNNSNTATITLTVRANTINNIKPVADSQNIAVKWNRPKQITLTASDADGDGLLYQVVTPPHHGQLDGNAPQLIYTPTPGYTGTDSFSFQCNDGKLDADVATVSLTIIARNSPPAADEQQLTTSANTGRRITLTATDDDGDPLTYHLLSNPTHGQLSGTPPELAYHPQSDYVGADSFTFNVNDGEQDSTPATISITMLSELANSPPVANDQNIAVMQDTPQLLTLTASDPDDNILTYTVIKAPEHGQLSGLLPLVLYTPAPGFQGFDALQFQVNDGLSNSNVALVNISIAAAGSQGAVAGMIYDDHNGNGLKESDELGIANVMVSMSTVNQRVGAYTDHGASTVRRATTNADGIYQFDQMPAIIYLLQLEVPAGYQATGPTTVQVEVSAGTQVTLQPLALRQKPLIFMPMVHR